MLCRHLTILLLTAFTALHARADHSSEQVRLAANGRYDLLERAVVERGTTTPLNTRDLHALCYAYSKIKRYAQLLACLDHLEAKIQTGDRRTRLFGLADATPTVHIMRAEAMIELARYPLAVVEAEKAIKWLKDDRSDDLDMLCNALATLSMAHTLSGDEDAGWKSEKELGSLRIGMFSDYANAKAFAHARARMALKDYRGVIAAISGDSTFAINVFLDKLVSGSFLTGVNNWVWTELPRAFMLNKALLETGNIGAAKTGFDRLLQIEQVKENGEIYWLLLNDRGRIAEEEGQSEEALRYYRLAIDVVEGQRASINTEASKIGFVGDKQQLYSRIIALAQQLEHLEMALEYIERSKSRALVDLLASREDIDLTLAKDQESRKFLERYQSAKNLTVLQNPLDMTSSVPGKSRQLVVSETRNLQTRDPHLASLVTVNALPAEEIRRHIRADEVLLEYFGFGDKLYGFAMTENRQLLLSLNIASLDAAVREFRQAILEQSSQTNALADSLYRQLIKPFEALIGTRNLLIVPHGALHYLPFAALQSDKNALIGERSLRLLPSTSVQKFIRPGGKSGLEGILIYGNPDLGNSQLDLPSAEEEARTIAALLPRSRIFTRAAASETSFKKQAMAFNYLHIASHGQFKAENALESRLLLAKDDENDGSLTVSELYQMRLDADLVTLSACETGLGKTLSGDDVLGLTRGFLYAGTTNIVSSLWEVDDEATAMLMKEFYRLLKVGTVKKEALRQAQLLLRKTHPAPIFWAAFYLTGEGI